MADKTAVGIVSSYATGYICGDSLYACAPFFEKSRRADYRYLLLAHQLIIMDFARNIIDDDFAAENVLYSDFVSIDALTTKQRQK